jgi:hypothetical protein
VSGYHNRTVVLKLVQQQWIKSLSGSINRIWRQSIDIENIVTKYRYTKYGDSVDIKNMVTKYRYTDYGDKLSIEYGGKVSI